MLRYQSDYSFFAIEVIAFFVQNTKKDLATPQVPYTAIWPLSRKRCASGFNLTHQGFEVNQDAPISADSSSGMAYFSTASPYASSTPVGAGTRSPVIIDFIIRAFATALPL